MNTLVVYDDCSNEPIEAQMKSLTFNYFVEALPNFCKHDSRQFVAMQDFLFRYEPEWVIQMDDDCFFDKNKALEEALSNDSIEKILVSSAFYGTCSNCSVAHISNRSHMLKNGLCALKGRNAGESISSLLGARQSAPDTLLAWTLSDPKLKIRGDLHFARGRSIIAGMGQTHDWLSDGGVFELDKRVYHFKHIKLFPLDEYLNKVKGDSLWGSIKPFDDPIKHWERIANYVCQVEVHST